MTTILFGIFLFLFFITLIGIPLIVAGRASEEDRLEIPEQDDGEFP